MTAETQTVDTRPAGKKEAEDFERSVDKGPDTIGILRRILGYLVTDETRTRVVLASISLLVSVGALMALPFIGGQGMNVLQAGGPTEELNQWVLIGVVVGVVYFIASFFADRAFASLSTHALKLLQNTLFRHLQTLSMGFFFSTPIGELVSRVNNDAEIVAQFYEQSLPQLIRSVLSIVLVIAIMLFINVPLTIVALLIVPFMLAVTIVVARVSGPAFERLQEELGVSTGFQEETLSGYRVIISKGRHAWANQTNDENAGRVFQIGSKANIVTSLQNPLTMILSNLQIVLVFVVGTILIVEGNSSLGTVVAFAGYVSLLSSPLSQIATLTTSALNAIAGGGRIFQILDTPPTVADAPDAKDYEFKGGHIEFRDVDFSYVPGQSILRKNDFEVQAGEQIGICGPTGAGKSTIINILTRYYDITGGQILIDGQDISKLTRKSLRRQIGAVLQEAFLFSDTVMNNLKYARDGATDEECIEAAKQANAHEFIEALPNGYDTVLTDRGASLSQGQRQMITIARAMVADPKILILDEATSNVDTRTEKLIQEGLNRLTEGRTSFAIAHRLSTIRHSDRIMVVNGGQIVEMASHDELMAKKGFYYALYMSQFKGAAPGGMEAIGVEFEST